MDVGEASSEHGGLHEACIGAGVFLGPATGAAALTFAPGVPNAFVWAVSGRCWCWAGLFAGAVWWGCEDSSHSR